MVISLVTELSFDMRWSSHLSSAALAASLLARDGALAQSSTLFQGATIITFDTTSSQIQVLSNASLLIEDDRIVQIFNNSASASPTNTTEVIDATGKIISPGFVDTHHHLWQTAFKTIASNTTLAEYYQRYGEFGPAIQYFSPDDKYLGQLTGCLELLNAGTTTVLDHAHGDSSNETTDAMLNATLDSGLRSYFALAVHELSNNYTVDDQMYKLESLADDDRLNQASLVWLGLAYDGFFDAPPDMIQRLWNIVRYDYRP